MTGGDSDNETARALWERAAKNRKMETGFTGRQCLNGPEGNDWKGPGRRMPVRRGAVQGSSASDLLLGNTGEELKIAVE